LRWQRAVVQTASTFVARQMAQSRRFYATHIRRHQDNYDNDAGRSVDISNDNEQHDSSSSGGDDDENDEHPSDEMDMV
jgi:type II secretory pathway pseudopilin PulG